MQQDVLSNLLKIPFLAKQSHETLAILAAKAKTVKFQKRAVIISEGQETNSLYIILSGKVRVFIADENNKEVTLMVQEEGTCFGLLSLLSNQPRSASVEALAPTLCGVISKSDFMNWLESRPDVAIAMLGTLSEKIISLTDKVKQLALSNAYERTVKILMEMATKEGDIFVIHNKPTQEALATMVGVTRETISKFMLGLTEGGYLSVHGKSIRIEKKLPAKF